MSQQQRENDGSWAITPKNLFYGFLVVMIISVHITMGELKQDIFQVKEENKVITNILRDISDKGCSTQIASKLERIYDNE